MEKFDLNLLQKRRSRAARRAARSGVETAGFLHLLAANQIADRLSVTNREFFRAAILFDGPFSDLIAGKLAALENVGSKPVPIPLAGQVESGRLPLEKESYDLIVSVFDLHWMNDLPGALAQINRALVSDGLFMAVLPGVNTMTEFRKALLSGELETTGGAAPRVDPFAEVRQFGDLLQRTGFRLPVADQEAIVLNYRDVAGIIRDLRDTGSSSTLSRHNPPLGRKVWAETVSFLEKSRNDAGKIPATMELVHLSGWKQHESQQQPLKPGSAAKSLADVLNKNDTE